MCTEKRWSEPGLQNFLPELGISQRCPPRLVYFDFDGKERFATPCMNRYALERSRSLSKYPTRPHRLASLCPSFLKPRTLQLFHPFPTRSLSSLPSGRVFFAVRRRRVSVALLKSLRLPCHRPCRHLEQQ